MRKTYFTIFNKHDAGIIIDAFAFLDFAFLFHQQKFHNN